MNSELDPAEVEAPERSRPSPPKTNPKDSAPAETTKPRRASVLRQTGETRVEVDLDLDGRGRVEVSTGLGFLDHMWTALAFHARFDLVLRCTGDLEVDDHHTAEDSALALGQAIREALGDRLGIQRFASAYAPLDEALARAVVDLSGRPSPNVRLGLQRECIGQVATENLTHALESLALELRASIHVDVLEGRNDHHRCEAAFKSLALALRSAVARDPRPPISRGMTATVPSTKGALA